MIFISYLITIIIIIIINSSSSGTYGNGGPVLLRQRWVWDQGLRQVIQWDKPRLWLRCWYVPCATGALFTLCSHTKWKVIFLFYRHIKIHRTFDFNGIFSTWQEWYHKNMILFLYPALPAALLTPSGL